MTDLDNRLQDEHDHIFSNDLPYIIESKKYEIASLLQEERFSNARSYARKCTDEFLSESDVLAALAGSILRICDNEIKEIMDENANGKKMDRIEDELEKLAFTKKQVI